MSSEKTVVEKLREAAEADTRGACCMKMLKATGMDLPDFDGCALWKHDIFNALADQLEAEHDEWKAKARCAEDYAAHLEKEVIQLKEILEQTLAKRNEYKRRLDFRKLLADEKGVVLKGLRDLANTSKHHSNAEWRRIVMRLTENAEVYANLVIAEAIAQTKEEHNEVDVAALDLLCDKLDCGSPNYQEIAKQIRKAMNGAEKPDTQEDIDADASLSFAEYTRKWPCPIDRADDSAAWHREHLLARQRKLLGGDDR